MATRPDAINRIERLLLSAPYHRAVNHVLSRTESGELRIATHRGVGCIDTTATSPEVRVVSGEHPLEPASQYPHAVASIVEMFEAEHAPDVMVIPHVEYFGEWPGQHGSLDRRHAQAPFVLGGPGVAKLGSSTPQHLRMVDVAPTLAAMFGVEPDANGCYLRGQTGLARTDFLDGTTPTAVFVVLLDGMNPDMLQRVTSSGEAPQLEAIIQQGTWFEGGVLSSLPTATLANHTSSLTGAHPGRTGIVHHTWLDRLNGQVHNLLDPAQVFWSSDHLSSAVETLFEAIHRTDPSAYTAAFFEYCDRGATFSNLALVRDEGFPELPGPDSIDCVNPEHLSAFLYLLGSQIDELSTQHAIGVWDSAPTIPRLSWFDFVLTDEAGHTGGPYSQMVWDAVVDSDRRLRRIVTAIERRMPIEEVTWVILADHSMAECDPDNTADWAAALETLDLPIRNVDGLIYLV